MYMGWQLVGNFGVHGNFNFREDNRGRPSRLVPYCLIAVGGMLARSQITRALCARLSRLDPSVVFVPGYYTLPAIAAAIWAKVHGKRSVLMTESTRQDHRRTWWKEKSRAS